MTSFIFRIVEIALKLDKNWKFNAKAFFTCYDSASGVNFINVLWAAFSYECWTWLITYLQKSCKNVLSYKKNAQFTLVKLTPGVNFTNIIRAAFSYECWTWLITYVQKSCKNVLSYKKAARIMLVKLTPGGFEKLVGLDLFASIILQNKPYFTFYN